MAGILMNKFFGNTHRITLASFLAYFVMSAMLAPMPIISAPLSELFNQPITEVTARFSWLTMGNLVGAILALVAFDVLRLRMIMLSVYSLIVASLLYLSIATGLLQIGLAMGVAGVCSGLGLAGGALAISRSYETEVRASMLVITDAMFSTAGYSITALTVAMVAAGLYWASPYIVVAGFAGVVVLLSMFSSYPEQTTSSTMEVTKEPWSLPVWLCIGALFLYTLGQWSILLWLPNYAETVLGASAESAGNLVSMFWLGLFAAQFVVAGVVLKLGVARLTMIAAVLTCVFSIPLWAYGDASALAVLAFAWGFANLSLLKVVLSYATQMLKVPTPRLVSALLLGATVGTAVSPFVTSKIVESTDNHFVLQFGTMCYALLAVLLFVASRRASVAP